MPLTPLLPMHPHRSFQSRLLLLLIHLLSQRPKHQLSLTLPRLLDAILIPQIRYNRSLVVLQVTPQSLSRKRRPNNVLVHA